MASMFSRSANGSAGELLASNMAATPDSEPRCDGVAGGAAPVVAGATGTGLWASDPVHNVCELSRRQKH